MKQYTSDPSDDLRTNKIVLKLLCSWGISTRTFYFILIQQHVQHVQTTAQTAYSPCIHLISHCSCSTHSVGQKVAVCDKNKAVGSCAQRSSKQRVAGDVRNLHSWTLRKIVALLEEVTHI